MSTTTDIRTLDKARVQHFLDNIGGDEFTVIFLKADGTQRKLAGRLDVGSTPRKDNVPFMETDTGLWKSFNVARVLWIGY